VRVRRSTENDAERRTTTLTCTELPVVTKLLETDRPCARRAGKRECEKGGGGY
jgi:hypothetical protein